MTKTKLCILALGAFFVPAVLVAGCGGVPGNAVAEVDGTAIEKDDVRPLARPSRRSPAARPARPCPSRRLRGLRRTQKRKTTPKPAKGQPKVTDAQLKTQCKQEYDALRDQVLQLLISFKWIEGEAKAMDIKVSDAEVKKSFDKQKKEAFPKAADFEKFLKDSGQTEEDILQRVRLDTLSNKIREKVTKGKDKVTDAQIAGLLQQEQAALRPARAARPADRPDQGQGQGRRRPRRRSRAASRSSRSRRSTRSTRPRRRRAASCRPSPRASRRRRSTRRSSTPRRAS